MEWLQELLNNSTTPALTALILGLLTAMSPCPLATNIAAIGYISKDVEDGGRILRNGISYTLGRMVAYSVLGIALILLIRKEPAHSAYKKSLRSGEPTCSVPC